MHTFLPSMALSLKKTIMAEIGSIDSNLSRLLEDRRSRMIELEQVEAALS
jgi:hypothetical protein